jgi:hypothetical protein
MAQKIQWLGLEDAGLVLVGSGAIVASGNTGDFFTTTVFGEAGMAIERFAVALDITVQGGSQASIDFDLEGKITGTKYYRMCRYNSVPADGVLVQVMCPQVGTKPLPIGDPRWLPFPEQWRLRWTFNTPGGSPTITLAAYAFGWGYRNSRGGFPGMRN